MHMENIIQTVLLFIITGLLGAIGVSLKKLFSKHLNRLDLLHFKTTSIDYGCAQLESGDKYKKYRDEKFEDLIEEDKIKNKNR